MPTNILRRRNSAVSAASAKPPRRDTKPRKIVISSGTIQVTAVLLATPTADRLWAALPLYSSAETWGQAVHLEVPIESGSEDGATVEADARTLYFWPDEHRLIMVFGRTPIARGAALRLPVPCNPIAISPTRLDVFAAARPGEQITLARAPRG